MGIFRNFVKAFSDAAKAGDAFNPALEGVMKRLEELHNEGHLDNVVFQAEQAYKAEHEGYIAKGIHTDAQDSANDLAAIKHFTKALRDSVDSLDPTIQPDVRKLLELQDAMEHILGNTFKK